MSPHVRMYTNKEKQTKIMSRTTTVDGGHPYWPMGHMHVDSEYLYMQEGEHFFLHTGIPGLSKLELSLMREKLLNKESIFNALKGKSRC